MSDRMKPARWSIDSQRICVRGTMTVGTRSSGPSSAAYIFSRTARQFSPHSAASRFVGSSARMSSAISSAPRVVAEREALAHLGERVVDRPLGDLRAGRTADGAEHRGLDARRREARARGTGAARRERVGDRQRARRTRPRRLAALRRADARDLELDLVGERDLLVAAARSGASQVLAAAEAGRQQRRGARRTPPRRTAGSRSGARSRSAGGGADRRCVRLAVARARPRPLGGVSPLRLREEGGSSDTGVSAAGSWRA